MAKKLLWRIEHRGMKYPTMRSRIGFQFRRLIFKTNWKASLFWRRWILKGRNPDYTQACTQGNCASVNPMVTCDKFGAECIGAADCANGNCQVTGSCDCPAPLPNSSKISNCSITCTATGSCARCTRFPWGRECNPSCSFSLCSAGTCGYDCTPPYVWDGVQCSLAAKQIIGDGLVFAEK